MLDVHSIPHILFAWTILTVSLTVAAWITPGVSIRGGILGHFVAAAIFAGVAWGAHALVHVACAALGVYAQVSLGFVARVVVLGFLLKLTSMVTSRVQVKSLLRALVAAFIVSVTTVALESLVGRWF